MKDDNLNRIINIVRTLKEEGSSPVIANSTNNPNGPVNIAGLPPDQPPVDLRRGRKRYWNPFFKDLAKIQRRKPPQ